MAFIFTDQNFQAEALQAKGLVVVDFWAPWCGPCQKVIPLIDKLAQTYPDVKIGKMNVDDNTAIPSHLGIMGIPAIKFFKNGKEVDEIVGAQPEAVFVQKIETHRSAANAANDSSLSAAA
jgi:thioredoxin 1